MGTAYLLYNPMSGEGNLEEDLDILEFVLDDSCVRCDMTKPETYGEHLFQISGEDYLVLCGGDGTMHRFVNLTRDLQLNREIFCYPGGCHNDFARDFHRTYGSNPFPVTKHLQSLPRLTTGNRKLNFLTAVVFYPHALVRQTSQRGKRYDHSVTVSACVDGQFHRYQKVRFAAVMYGKYCCGGMTPDPDRSRNREDLSCVVIHGCGKRRARHLLRQLTKGRSIRSRCLSIARGKEICLSFEKPVSILADGEELSDIQTFTASRH